MGGIPQPKPADVAKAALLIQTYYRGFKARKALRDQQKRQDQVRADLSEAAFRVGLSSDKREKKILKNLPKTPMQSVEMTAPPPRQKKPTRPPLPQRPTPRVPSNVDERDFKKKPQRPMRPAPAAVVEEKSKEFAHHPADIVAAAMTIQRFFRNVKAKKEQSKKARTTQRMISTTSTVSSSSASSSKKSSSVASSKKTKRTVSTASSVSTV